MQCMSRHVMIKGSIRLHSWSLTINQKLIVFPLFTGGKHRVDNDIASLCKFQHWF